MPSVGRMGDLRPSDWLPTTRKEVEARGWDSLDVILFSGDAYVDHPSFGAAVIARTIESLGLRVAVVPQPDWHGDLRDFRKLGRPRLFFAVSPGNMDSMVNKYTAARRLRSEDAYSPDGRHDARPEYPSVVYSRILRELFPGVPIVLGGIEASLRRLTHYDYWKDRLMRCILFDSGADMITYGMGERATIELCRRLSGGIPIGRVRDVPQTVFIVDRDDVPGGVTGNDVVLHSHEECLADRRAQAENFGAIERESNMMRARRILQETSGRWVVVNPPYPPMTTEELDRFSDLPYTRMPHPKYRGKRIAAYEMIRHSVTIHRGCFGGCAFCTISAHQGKFVTSRSEESILREVAKVTRMEDFRGYVSDIGGPSANMYGMGGRDLALCGRCSRPSCATPRVCPNLNVDHGRLLELYRAVDRVPGVRKSLVGSGVRYDLLLHDNGDAGLNRASREYTRELIARHVGGRLKVAPEHTSDRVLRLMRKPPFSQFEEFKAIFDRINAREGLGQQIVPYFMSCHPGCTAEDMAELAVATRRLDFRLEQVQDFTPTPMTVSTETWYTGYDPRTMERVFSARTPEERRAQRMFFFWYRPENRRQIERELRRMGRPDLIPGLFGPAGGMPAGRGRNSKGMSHEGDGERDDRKGRPGGVRGRDRR